MAAEGPGAGQSSTVLLPFHALWTLFQLGLEGMNAIGGVVGSLHQLFRTNPAGSGIDRGFSGINIHVRPHDSRNRK